MEESVAGRVCTCTCERNAQLREALGEEDTHGTHWDELLPRPLLYAHSLPAWVVLETYWLPLQNCCYLPFQGALPGTRLGVLRELPLHLQTLLSTPQGPTLPAVCSTTLLASLSHALGGGGESREAFSLKALRSEPQR